jgi:hypothetical protein
MSPIKYYLNGDYGTIFANLILLYYLKVLDARRLSAYPFLALLSFPQ